MRRYCVLLAFSSLVALAVPADAQQGGSSLRGRIVDQQGAVLPGVAIGGGGFPRQLQLGMRLGF
jgi:hypothetical protein